MITRGILKIKLSLCSPKKSLGESFLALF